jgi:hypothetical protein
VDLDGSGLSHGFTEHGKAFVTQPTQHRWKFEVDATHLMAGEYYKICLDLDGSASTLGWGDTGFGCLHVGDE